MTTKSIYKSTAGQVEIQALVDRVLAQWPVPNQHIHIPTRYGDTFAIASGDMIAPPLILLHGTASNSATWMGDIADLASTFRVYAVDIPGEPGKSDPTRFSWDGPAFTEWLDDVLEGLGVEKTVLAGMSLGGWATLRYAIDRPAHVVAAVTIVPAGIQQPRLAFILRAIGYSFLGDWGRDRLKDYIFQGGQFPDDLDRFLTLVSKHFNFRTGAPPLFTDEALQSLSMPVLLVAGEDDVMLDTTKTAERMGAKVPDLTVRIYAGDGHATINTATDVLAFLQAQELVQADTNGAIAQMA